MVRAQRDRKRPHQSFSGAQNCGARRQRTLAGEPRLSFGVTPTIADADGNDVSAHAAGSDAACAPVARHPLRTSSAKPRPAGGGFEKGKPWDSPHLRSIHQRPQTNKRTNQQHEAKCCQKPLSAGFCGQEPPRRTLPLFGTCGLLGSPGVGVDVDPPESWRQRGNSWGLRFGFCERYLPTLLLPSGHCNRPPPSFTTPRTLLRALSPIPMQN
eukprot:365995-Chlamydomonas_euryale.AAC.11